VAVTGLPSIGVTAGFIDETNTGTVDRSTIEITDELNPAGVRIKADPESGLTDPGSGLPVPGPVFSACDGTVTFIPVRAGSEQVVACSSVDIKVTSGAFENTFIATDGRVAIATVDEGNGLIFGPVTFTFTALITNTDKVVVVIGNKKLFLDPGESEMFEGSLGQCISSIRENCSGLKGKQLSECNHAQQAICHGLFGVP